MKGKRQEEICTIMTTDFHILYKNVQNILNIFENT